MTNKINQKIRFGIVGAINTGLDFGLLFLLKALGIPTIPANVISSGSAFIFSFFANRSYTFKTAKSTNLRQQIIRFCLVTLFGIWVLQSIILALLSPPLGHLVSDPLALFIAKIIATICSLTWNYTLYDRFVFTANDSPATKQSTDH